MGHMTLLVVSMVAFPVLTVLLPLEVPVENSHRNSTLACGAVSISLSNKGVWKAGGRTDS